MLCVCQADKQFTYGYVVPDGWDEVHFNRGASITVDLNAPKLRLLTFRQSMKERLLESIGK